MVEQTESMLELYRLQCEKGERRKTTKIPGAESLCLEGKDYQLIAEKESISKSTVFRDIDLATEELSVMLFGADIFMTWMLPTMGKSWEQSKKRMWYNSYTAKLNIKPRGKSCAVKVRLFSARSTKNEGFAPEEAVLCCKNRKNLLTLCAHDI